MCPSCQEKNKGTKPVTVAIPVVEEPEIEIIDTMTKGKKSAINKANRAGAKKREQKSRAKTDKKQVVKMGLDTSVSDFNSSMDIGKDSSKLLG